MGKLDDIYETTYKDICKTMGELQPLAFLISATLVLAGIFAKGSSLQRFESPALVAAYCFLFAYFNLFAFKFTKYSLFFIAGVISGLIGFLYVLSAAGGFSLIVNTFGFRPTNDIINAIGYEKSELLMMIVYSTILALFSGVSGMYIYKYKKYDIIFQNFTYQIFKSPIFILAFLFSILNEPSNYIIYTCWSFLEKVLKNNTVGFYLSILLIVSVCILFLFILITKIDTYIKQFFENKKYMQSIVPLLVIFLILYVSLNIIYTCWFFLEKVLKNISVLLIIIVCMGILFYLIIKVDAYITEVQNNNSEKVQEFSSDESV
jgi:hypothetical protein